MSSFFLSGNELLTVLRKLILPKLRFESVEQIPMLDLFQQGYRNVFLDIDNTIMAYEERQVSLQKQTWVEKVKAIGFNVFILSNNSSKKRIVRVAKDLQITGLYFAMKPLSYGLNDLHYQHQLDVNESIIIGDQILTDVIVGNWSRCHTILVDPMNIKTSFIKSMQKQIETTILNKLSRKTSKRPTPFN